MTDSPNNVSDLHAHRSLADSNGGNGGEGNLLHLYERVSALETRINYLATKEDIQSVKTDLEVGIRDIKIWILVGAFSTVCVLSAIIIGALNLIR